MLLPGAHACRYSRINATSDGANTVIENADTTKQIVVIAYAFTVNAAGVVTFQDSTGTPVVHASFELSDGGGVSFAGSPAGPAFEVARGKNFVISNAAGVDSLGHITYLVRGTN